MRSSGIGQAVLLTSGAAVVTMALLFLETTLAARLVSTDDFGVYVLIVAAVNFVMMVVDFGSKTAVTQLIARGEASRQASLVTTALLFRVSVIACVSVLVLWPARGALALLGSSESVDQYIWQLPAMTLVASLDQLLFGMLQGFQAYRSLAVAQTVRSVLRLALTATLLGPLSMGVTGLLYSWTLSFATSALYQYIALPVPRRAGISRAILKELLHFGAPLQAAGFLWFVFTRIQTFILGAFGGPTAVALFAVASRIPEALQQVAESYMAVYFPKMTALLVGGRHAQASLMFQTSLRLVSFGAAALALGGVLLCTEITEVIFSVRYAASAPAFAVLMIGLHMVLVVNLMGYTLTSAGRPRQSLVVDVARTAVVLAASLALVPVLGFMGAAWARLVSSYGGAPVVVTLLRREKLAKGNDAWLTSTVILLVCSVLAAITHDGGPIAKFGVAALFATLSWKLGAIGMDDVRLILPTGFRQPTPAPVGDSV